jgi:hypothetical protein
VKEGLTAEQVKNGFRFYTSDAEGEYLILVKGKKENGEVVTGSAVVTVVPFTTE